MNKTIITLKTALLIFATTLVFSSCSDEASVSTPDTSLFNYEIDELVGIWQTTEMLEDETATWYSVNSSDSPYYLFYFDIRFNSDYTYSLTSKASASESGTYTAKNTLVTTYQSGVLQAEYDIKSLDDGVMEITLVRGTDATDYRLTKRW